MLGSANPSWLDAIMHRAGVACSRITTWFPEHGQALLRPSGSRNLSQSQSQPSGYESVPRTMPATTIASPAVASTALIDARTHPADFSANWSLVPRRQLTIPEKS